MNCLLISKRCDVNDWFLVFYADFEFIDSLYDDFMGKIFYEKSPGQISGEFGYRTSMSMKNRNTWEFAGVIGLPLQCFP